MSGAILTFVVDDEALARKRVVRMLRDDSDINIVGSFSSAREAAAQARARAPHLLFLDICMPELDGVEFAASLAEQGINPYIVFLTAYADRSMDAFRVGAVDYLVKPFDDERFARALTRAKLLIASGNERIASCAVEPPLRNGRMCLVLAENGKVVVLPVRDIEFIQASMRQVKLYAVDRRFSFRQSLGHLESRLDPVTFVRVHRSTLVNVEHIAEIRPRLHGDYELTLRRGARLTLSRRYRDRLARLLLE